MPEASVPQRTESGFDADRRTHIAEKLNFLTTNISLSHVDDTSKYSRKYLYEDLKDEEKETVDFLLHFTTPDELVEVIYSSPPTVFFKAEKGADPKQIRPVFEIREATEDELALAERELVPPPGVNAEMLKLMSSQISSYLKAPRIADGLSDHTTERTPWIATVNAVLNLIDERKGDGKHVWYEKLRDKWNNNKYKTNRLTTTFGYLLAIEGSLGKSSPTSIAIEEIHKEAVRIVADEKEDKDRRTDKITGQLGKIISLFSPSQSLQ